MYVKHKKIMEASGVDIVQLDGTRSKEQLYNTVYGECRISSISIKRRSGDLRWWNRHFIHMSKFLYC
uniref:Uncharacterized protein n=1 Tax=Anguilla anguilla TaxID=7936 RepID=A0A0E9U6X2_ANGAN